MKRPVIYYHLWREGDWRSVNAQVLTSIVESGLIEYAEKINICIPDDLPLTDLYLHGIPEEKAEVRRVRNTRTEWPTLELMYDEYIGQTDVPLLYVHSKGASYEPSHPRREPVRSWVDGLLYYLVEDWRECLSVMRTGGMSVGANKLDHPRVHFSGNFWWINSTGLQALPNPKGQDQSYDNRFGAEFWIGFLGSNNLRNNGLVGFNYEKIIPRSVYAKPKTSPRSHKNICLHIDSNLDISAIRKSQFAHELYSNPLNSYSVSYLDYIIDNYENLPDFSYFVRTSQLVQHTPNLFDIVGTNNTPQFELLSKSILKCNNVGEPHHAGLPLLRFWDAIYPEYECPSEFTFGAGAQFLASREMIQRNSLDFYMNVRSLISSRVNPLEDYILERLWQSIFGEKSASSLGDFDPEVYIFNYGQMENALTLRSQFDAIGVRAYVLDSASGEDVPELDYVFEFPNIYYSGLWNEALSMFSGSHLMVITSDVKIPDASRLINNAKQFFKSDKAWIYAPNVNYTFWNYDLGSLPDIGRNIKQVPNTDGMCWMLSSDAAFSVGNVDNEINKIGFGIDLLAAMLAYRENKLVGRDYSIEVIHPQTRSYDSSEAEKQEFEWINSLGYFKEYIQYRNHYSMSFLR